MASISSSLLTINSASQWKVTNLDITFANTEVAHTLQDGCKYVEIVARNGSKVQVSDGIGESGTRYKTIWKKTSWYLQGMSFTGKVLYVQCDQASEILEIVELY